MISHNGAVRQQRTNVNVENVSTLCEFVYVPNATDLADQLKVLRERSGLSLEQVAKRAGYAGRSSVQKYFDGSYEAEFLPMSVAGRLADALEGKGSPPIARDEVLSLALFPHLAEAKPFYMEGASLARMQRDVPVYGTALGSARIIGGEAIEQTELNSGEIIDYFKRPVILDGRADVYGLYIQGSSMSPRFEEGETAFVEGKRPPRVGDDVIVYLRGENNRTSAALLKRYVRRTAQYLELEQFNPRHMFKIPIEEVAEMHRVIPWAELLS